VVIYFSVGPTTIDVDNIAKPIVDALKGVVYPDDDKLTQITLRKTELTTSLRLSSPPRRLAEAIDNPSGRDFVYVRIGPGPNHSEVPR
jgi:hypothetical protein